MENVYSFWISILIQFSQPLQGSLQERGKRDRDNIGLKVLKQEKYPIKLSDRLLLCVSACLVSEMWGWGLNAHPPPPHYLRADDDSDCFSYNIFSKKIDIYYFCLNCLNRVCQNNISFFGPNMYDFFVVFCIDFHGYDKTSFPPDFFRFISVCGVIS